MGNLEEIFLNIFQTSINASIVIVCIIGVTKLFSERINVRIKYILWILAVIRLLIPVVPGININTIDIMSKDNDIKVQNQTSEIINNSVIADKEEAKFDDVNSNSSKLNNANFQVQSYNSNENTIKNKVNITENIAIFKSGISFVWCVGFFAFASTFMFGVNHFRKRVVILDGENHKEIIELTKGLINKLNIHKEVPIYVSNDIKSPCISGIINPTIYIPEYILEIEDTDKLTHVFLHELMHLKRKDLYYNLFSIIAVSIHWFNPLAWIAIKEMRNYREYVCDASVLEFIGEDNNIDYGTTLIDCSRKCLERKKINSFQLAICFEEKNQIKGRISMISKFKNGSIKMTKKGALACLAASALILASGVVVFNKTEPASASDITSEAAAKEKVNFIIDSDIKTYTDVNQASKAVEFDFKLPSYIGDGINYNYTEIKKVNDSEVLAMWYSNEGNYKANFQLYAFKENPEEVLKTIARNNHGHEGNTTVESNPLKLGDIDGQDIVVKNLMLESDEVKSFAWKDNDVWYAITYYINSYNSIFSDINQEEVQKVAESLVDLSQIDTEQYTSKLPEEDVKKTNIYSEEDLNKAKELLGFEPKIPRNFSDDIKLESSTVYKFKEFTSITSEYNKHTISLTESKLNEEYQNYSIKDIVEESDKDMKEYYSEVKSEKLEGTEIEAYRTLSTKIDPNNEKSTYISYYWIGDGISYSINIINRDKENLDIAHCDDIAKKFINAK